MSLLLDKKAIAIVVQNVSPKDGWVQFNLKSIGYYLVHYDRRLYENLIEHRLADMTSLSCKIAYP